MHRITADLPPYALEDPAGAVAQADDADEVEGGGEPRREPLGIDPVPLMTQQRDSRPGVGLSHQAAGEAVLFSFSDRVVQEKLGLWREARGNA